MFRWEVGWRDGGGDDMKKGKVRERTLKEKCFVLFFPATQAVTKGWEL